MNRRTQTTTDTERVDKLLQMIANFKFGSDDREITVPLRILALCIDRIESTSYFDQYVERPQARQPEYLPINKQTNYVPVSKYNSYPPSRRQNDYSRKDFV